MTTVVAGGETPSVPPVIDAQRTVHVMDLAIETSSDLQAPKEVSDIVQNTAYVDVVKVTVSGPEHKVENSEVTKVTIEPHTVPAKAAVAANPYSWCDLAKGEKCLQKKGTAFILCQDPEQHY